MTAEKYTRARQLDFFVATLSDVNLRDQRDTMERPFFALSKSRKTPIVYRSPKGDVDVEISPNVKYGMATIWDFDILIWAASQINQIRESGDRARWDELLRTKSLFFHPADMLKAIGRNTGGKDREELRAALDRLASTYVKTNIRQEHQGTDRARGFTWLDGWDEETEKHSGQTKGMSITLAQWFFMGAINQTMLLAVDPDYFSLRGGIERWLYRVARKHAHGLPEGFSFTLSTLHEKSGSEQPKPQFKRDLRKVIERGDILGYGFEWTERGRGQDPLLRIYPVPEHQKIQQIADAHAGKQRKRDADAAIWANPDRFSELIHPEKLRYLRGQFPNADLPDMFARFVLWNNKRGGRPRDMLSAFAGFMREHQTRQRMSQNG